MVLGSKRLLHRVHPVRMDDNVLEDFSRSHLRIMSMYMVSLDFSAPPILLLTCLSWGTAAMCSGAANNMAELVVTRVFLGVFEATFGAGAPYFLSCIYKRSELGLRMSILLGMSPLANTFASSLAYGITHIKGSLEAWRWLFIIGTLFTLRFRQC